MKPVFRLFAVLFLLIATSAQAGIHHVRWEQQFGLTGQIQMILPRLMREPGVPRLTPADFLEVEARTLANYRFATYLQLFEGIPVKGALVRTWENLETGHLVLMEAHVDDGATASQRLKRLTQYNLNKLKNRIEPLSGDARVLARPVIAKTTDSKIAKIASHDQWNGVDLERVVTVHGKRGIHTVIYSHFTGKAKARTYNEYPQADVMAMVYPIYEEPENSKKVQKRIPVILKNLNAYRKEFAVDHLASLKQRNYLESKIDDVKAATPEGESAGYWSIGSINALVVGLIRNLPSVPNTYENGGLYLDGKYATVSLHPDVVKFKGVTVPLKSSERAFFNWAPLPDGSDWAMTIATPFKSRPLMTPEAALERPARRLPDHDPVAYLNDGFDEIQVYYAIDVLMESLRAMGFTDPELSTRPFHAFLYNPDIEMRDNAYYTQDTINFTTYSPESLNYARDNTTIWHELGHGIMDRLMGDRIVLADSGGLSEGMADFVAQLIIQDKTDGQPFDGWQNMRIINNTGFNLTNESHDDGEAYGGAMYDFLKLALEKDGRKGLLKVTDVVLDAMRLARNHPSLTANEWFEAVIYADRLGRPGVRMPGELSGFIKQALAHRNFRFDQGRPAEMKVVSDGETLTSESPGSRSKPIPHKLAAGETASHDLVVSITGSENYKFKYPVTVEVGFSGGALQGAVKWEGEEAGPRKFVLNSETDVARFKLTALSGCDLVNQEGGGCRDYAYIMIKNNGEERPVAKKRFYLKVSGK